MTTYPNIGLVLPTRGAPGSGHWADVLDSNTALLDAHDHQSGRGLPIRSAALTIDGNVSFNTSWAITALNRVTFASVAAPAVNKSVWVADGTGGTTANELYWTTNTGANVKLTSGTTLNVGAFVGGIGGDYTSVGAQLNYDDAGKRYTLKEGTGDANGWARVACGGLRLIEFNTTETVFVGQVAPAALAVSYTMTWPTALPGSTLLQQVDNTGQIIWSNTVQAVTFDTNQNVTLQGTGEIKHGNRTLTLAAVIGALSSGTFTVATDGSVTSTASGAWNVPVPLLQGDRVQSVTLAGFGDGSVDIQIDVKYIGKTGGSSTKATTAITNAPASWNDTTATAGAPAALAAGEVCVITVTPNATGFAFNNLRVVYDRP